MGHRHTSEEQGGELAVRETDRGFTAVAVESIKTLPQHPFVDARDKAAPLRGIGVRAALFALRFYKAYLSLLFAGGCRFEPTCSRYAYEAVERFGVARGIWLAVKRLGRCQPLSPKFGYDPVPETWGHGTSPAPLPEVAGHPAAARPEVHT
jgi:putative membrane protein insertion efficiency factor